MKPLTDPGVLFELTGIPEEYMELFEKGIPSNWSSILQEANSRPSSFLSTLPPLSSPIASTSRLPEPQHIPRKRPDKNLPPSLFDLGTGYQPQGRKMRTARELANSIRDRKGKGRAVNEARGKNDGALAERDADYDEEAEIAKEEEEKRKLETAKPPQEITETQDRSQDLDVEMAKERDESALEPDPPPPPILPSPSPKNSSPPPEPTPTSPKPAQSSSRMSQPPLESANRTAFTTLVSDFFIQPLPTLTATEGPYVTYVPKLNVDTRNLLESLAHPVTLAQVPKKKIKRPSKPYRLVEKPLDSLSATLIPIANSTEDIEAQEVEVVDVEARKLSPSCKEPSITQEEEDVPMADAQDDVDESQARVQVVEEKQNGLEETDDNEVLRNLEEEVIAGPGKDLPPEIELVENGSERKGVSEMEYRRNIDEVEVRENGGPETGEEVDESRLKEVEADVEMQEVELSEGGVLEGEETEKGQITIGDEEDLEEDAEEIIEERKVFLTLSPRSEFDLCNGFNIGSTDCSSLRFTVTGERDEIVPVKLDPSSPIPGSFSFALSS